MGTTVTRSLLHQVLQTGELMIQALDVDDVETYTQLLNERGRIIEQLQGSEQPSRANPEDDPLLISLDKQSTTIRQAFEACELRLEQAILELRRKRNAEGKYNAGVSIPRYLDERLTG